MDAGRLAADISGLSLDTGQTAKLHIMDTLQATEGLIAALRAAISTPVADNRLARRASGSLALGAMAGMAGGPLLGTTVAGLSFVAKTLLSSGVPLRGLSRDRAAKAVGSFEWFVMEGRPEHWSAK